MKVPVAFTVTPNTIRVGDKVRVHDAHRIVRDLTALPGGGRLLHFDGGGTHRLPRGSGLEALRWVERTSD